MTDKTVRTVHAWLQLSPSEKVAFANAVNAFEQASNQRQLNESYESEFRNITKVQTGPLSGGCPYCGR